MREILIIYNAVKCELMEHYMRIEFNNYVKRKLIALIDELSTTKPCKLGNEIMLEIQLFEINNSDNNQLLIT